MCKDDKKINSEQCITWFKSYLNGKLNYSQLSEVTDARIAQGTVPEPLLSVLYINNVYMVILQLFMQFTT